MSVSYSTKSLQNQRIVHTGKKWIGIEARGGTLSDEDAQAIRESEWGGRLIEAGVLILESSADNSDSAEIGTETNEVGQKTSSIPASRGRSK